MRTQQSAHAGQLLASQRRANSAENQSHCSFCGTVISTESEEHVEYSLATDDSIHERSELYCSPSCFIREMEQISGI